MHRTVALVNDCLTFWLQATIDTSAEGVYVTIPAGASIAVNHTGLASLFDFETFGTGTFSFAPHTIFQSGPRDVPLHVTTDAITVEVTSDVSKRELFPLHRRSTDLSTPTCSDSGRLQAITVALSYARSLAGGAATDINSHPNGPEYTTYFGGNTQSDIWYNFDRIAGDLPSSGTRKCVRFGDGFCLVLMRFLFFLLVYIALVTRRHSAVGAVVSSLTPSLLKAEAALSVAT